MPINISNSDYSKKCAIHYLLVSQSNFSNVQYLTNLQYNYNKFMYKIISLGYHSA